jgi:hypothetical protein
VPRPIAPIPIPTVLAVITHIMSAACIPNSSAMGRSDERDRLRVEAVKQCDGEAQSNNTLAASVHRTLVHKTELRASERMPWLRPRDGPGDRDDDHMPATASSLEDRFGA